MGAASIPRLFTVEEFERLPAPSSGHYELRHGEVVLVTPPVHSHKLLQRRLRELLQDMSDTNGSVADTVYAFRPLPESEVWVGDVVCISAAREAQITKWLEGSPELVIEVKSRSNMRNELHDKTMTVLAGQGSIEFWIVDPETESVTAYNKASGVHIYQRSMGHDVPVPMFAGHISLDQLFAGL